MSSLGGGGGSDGKEGGVGGSLNIRQGGGGQSKQSQHPQSPAFELATDHAPSLSSPFRQGQIPPHPTLNMSTSSSKDDFNKSAGFMAQNLMDDFEVSNGDPMWAEEMFDADGMGEEEGMGMGVGELGDWRGAQNASPGTSPVPSSAQLPLASESPAFTSRGDDFGSTEGETTNLHTLIPTLGFSQPRSIPQTTTTSNIDNSKNNNQIPPAFSGQISPTSTSSLSGSLPKTPTSHQPLYGFAGTAPGSSPPDLRRQAGISAALASSTRANASASTLSGSASQRPSPLGQHYLAQNDPQHISKQPMGSIQFTSMQHQPLFPTMAPLRNPTEASPTLAMETDERLTDYDAFTEGGFGGSASGSVAGNMFAPLSAIVGGGGGSGGGGARSHQSPSGSLQPHQVPLPPSPAMGFYSTASPPVRVSQDFGHPSSPSMGRPGRNFEEPSMAPNRPRMRQSTEESFGSTSSEEEDISSPMILQDVPMGRKSGSSPSMGPSPRMTGFSPRSNPSGSISAGAGASSSSKPMFPDLRKVQDLAKMKSPIPVGGGGGVPRASFSFQPGKSAPVFPPMSSSSSSSGFDDDDDDTMTPEGSDNEPQQSARTYAPLGRAQRPSIGQRQQGQEQADSAEGGGSGSRNGGGSSEASNSRPAFYRAASITVGGPGYHDFGDNDDDGSDDEPRRPPPKDTRGRAEDHVPRRVKAKRSISRGQEKEKPVESPKAATIKSAQAQAQASPGPSSSAAVDRSTESGNEDEEEDDDQGDDEDDADEDFAKGKKRRVSKVAATGDSKPKRRKSAVQDAGSVFCSYIDPVPPHEPCDSRFHRVYDLERHYATIHARDEGRKVRAGTLKAADATLWNQYGRPQTEWICSCGQVFSRKDAMQRHQAGRKHQGELRSAN